MAHLTVGEQRQKIREMFLVPKDQLVPVKNVEDKNIEGTHGNIPIRIITPEKSNKNNVIVFFHRGGWVFGSNDEAEGLCRKIAIKTHHTVVQVDYRLSPEHKFRGFNEHEKRKW
jgi:acetyl esterase